MGDISTDDDAFYVREMLKCKRDILYLDIKGLFEVFESVRRWSQVANKVESIISHLTENLNDIQDELEEEWDIPQMDFDFSCDKENLEKIVADDFNKLYVLR